MRGGRGDEVPSPLPTPQPWYVTLPRAQGFLTPALDGSQLFFACYNTSVGSAKSTNGMIGQLFPTGPVLSFAPAGFGNAAYEFLSIAGFNSTTTFPAVGGGSANGGWSWWPWRP